LILKRVGEVAYQLKLPDHLADVHDVFHVSQLKKCLRVPEEQLPMEDFSVQDCDGTSQVIRPIYSCPYPTDLGQPCRCT
jgi:hypothetical protein